MSDQEYESFIEALEELKCAQRKLIEVLQGVSMDLEVLLEQMETNDD